MKIVYKSQKNLEIENRQKVIDIFKEEIKNSNKYDYVVINNTVDKSVEEIISIIKKEKI